MSGAINPELPSPKFYRIFTNCFSCCYGERCTKLRTSVASHPLCPSWKNVSRLLAMGIFGLTIWGSSFSMVGNMAGPEGQMFKIGALGVAAQIAGWLVAFLGLPPLLGMLLMGILLRNIGFILFKGGFLKVAAALRQMALVIILTRAGLGLDPKALRRLGAMVTRLAVAPSFAEIIFSAIMSHLLLGLPWIWGFLLGSVLAAVSPAVVIPCLFSLQDRGYGKTKGIPTLVIAAAGFDDIISISAFGVVLGLIFSASNLVAKILHAPLGIIFGLVGGIAYGLLLRFIPHKKDCRVHMFRTILLAGGGLLFMFGSNAVGYEGTGPLGVIVAAFVSCNGWDSKGSNGKAEVQDNFLVLWSVFQPILFGLIGTEINLFVLEANAVGKGIACLLIALAARIAISVVAAAGGNLTWKEKLFVSFAWFPKATVQAAIGPIALDNAREIGNEEYITYATNVLMVAVLAILITAPIGAILITFLGPKLLQKELPPNVEPQEEIATVESIERTEEHVYTNESFH